MKKTYFSTSKNWHLCIGSVLSGMTAGNGEKSIDPLTWLCLGLKALSAARAQYPCLPTALEGCKDAKLHARQHDLEISLAHVYQGGSLFPSGSYHIPTSTSLNSRWPCWRGDGWVEEGASRAWIKLLRKPVPSDLYSGDTTSLLLYSPALHPARDPAYHTGSSATHAESWTYYCTY